VESAPVTIVMRLHHQTYREFLERADPLQPRDVSSETGGISASQNAQRRLFYHQKYWEFVDTFIFMLRKSYRQVGPAYLGRAGHYSL
jgi:hypothetical protein